MIQSSGVSKRKDRSIIRDLHIPQTGFTEQKITVKVTAARISNSK
jgi:hypothetical protein